MNYKQIAQWAKEEQARDQERLSKFQSHKANAEEILAGIEAGDAQMAQFLHCLADSLP